MLCSHCNASYPLPELAAHLRRSGLLGEVAELVAFIMGGIAEQGGWHICPLCDARCGSRVILSHLVSEHSVRALGKFVWERIEPEPVSPGTLKENLNDPALL